MVTNTLAYSFLYHSSSSYCIDLYCTGFKYSKALIIDPVVFSKQKSFKILTTTVKTIKRFMSFMEKLFTLVKYRVMAVRVRDLTSRSTLTSS